MLYCIGNMTTKDVPRLQHPHATRRIVILVYSIYHMRSLILCFIALHSLTLSAQNFFNKDQGLAHTFSIVARDPKTGEMAVAVQSHWFSVGTSVTWGEAGVGVVATQSFVNKSFGMRGLNLLRDGRSPQETLNILLSDDSGKEVRQVAILDTSGRVATHT